ncbi:MAG TPA: TetR/AcrR family transcriptional regulator [Baekduia sp.]|nr:TetR/AcrR family transcriptional regulator [Baekduia sp.]
MATARRPASPPLPRGRHALSGDELTAAHRARLHEAVVKLLGTQGYGGTSVDELAAAAGVSTATLYGLFAGKQELVLDTFDAIVADAAGRLRNRGGWDRDQGDLRQALAGVLSAVADVVLRQSDAARLVVVDIPALGPAGIQRRRALTDGLQELLRRAATTADGLTVLSEPALGVLAGGTLQVLDRHLRSGRLRPLRSAALDLAAWGAAYETDAPQPLPARSPFTTAVPDRARASTQPPSQGLPHGRHGLPAAFVQRHQRERILEAVLALSAEQGFEVTSARELATRAGLSRQTFYQHYATKEDAWSAAFDQAFLELFATAWHAGAAQRTAEGKVTAAVTACLEQLIAEPAWARLLLVDAASAGATGSAAIDRAMVAFARLIAGAAGKRELPAIVPLAMVGGIINLVGGWIVEDRTAELTDLTPALVEVLFVPLFGASAARTAVRRLAAAAGPGAPPDDELRLMDAFARAVVADGLTATRLADIARREEIPLDIVDALFDDELDCATQALDVWTGQLVAAAAGAYLSAALDRPLAAHRALGAALTHIAQTPAISALAVADDPEIVSIVAKLRARYATLFLALIGGQLPPADARAPQPAALLEVVLEGILAVVARFAQEERLAELPDELETLSLQSLTPFFGAAEAQRVAERSAALR